MAIKTHWKKVFNSDFLGSCDLEDGKDLFVTIKDVRIRSVRGSDGKESDCNVSDFTDPKIKPMILNVTNCKIVSKFAKSKFIEDWVNIPVTIYVDSNVKVGREITEGLRIREIQPIIVKPELTPSMPAWENVVKYLKGSGKMVDIKAKYRLSTENEDRLQRDVAE